MAALHAAPGLLVQVPLLEKGPRRNVEQVQLGVGPELELERHRRRTQKGKR